MTGRREDKLTTNRIAWRGVKAKTETQSWWRPAIILRNGVNQARQGKANSKYDKQPMA